MEEEKKESLAFENRKPEKRPLKDIFDWLELFVFSVSIIFIIFTFFIRPARVNGHSMETTLQDKDFLLISDLFYTPKSGDIVVFDPPADSIFGSALVKRVIATGGQWVDIDFENWTVRISDDGETWTTLDETYVNHESGWMTSSSFSYPMQVPEGEIFVMGDNRNHSTDSRDIRLGTVQEERVLGRALVRLFPFNRISLLT